MRSGAPRFRALNAWLNEGRVKSSNESVCAFVSLVLHPIPHGFILDVYVCAVDERGACIHTHPSLSPPPYPLVSLWLSATPSARAPTHTFTTSNERMISTCDLSTVSSRCHSIFLHHLLLLMFTRSFSHQPSNGKSSSPRRRQFAHGNNNNNHQQSHELYRDIL